MKKLLNVNDFKSVARKKVPKMFFDYVESGSWDGNTLKSNREDFLKIKLIQRVAVDVSKRNTEVSILGTNYNMPLALAPAGLTGMQRADGEILAALAAEKFNIPYTLSTFSICSIEEVSEKINKPFWFQLYIMKDKNFLKNIIHRAKSAGCSALMITLDLQVLGKRYADIKNDLSVPPNFFSLRNIKNLTIKPNWVFRMLQTKNREFGNIVGHVEGVSNLKSLSSWVSNSFDQTFSWDDIKFIRDLWKGKLILKGILNEIDALKALDTGADAIIVSNHGGRQLDSVPSSISMLPNIKKIANGKTEVWVDGGIRSGIDVLKACSLGADLSLIGRPYLYALGAYGEKGVSEILRIFQEDLDLAMALCGKTRISQLNFKNVLFNF